ETLYAALGDPNTNVANGVYFAQNPYLVAAPAWSSFRFPSLQPAPGVGNIKIAAIATNPATPTVFPNITVYAAITDLPNIFPIPSFELRSIQVSTDGGQTWNATTAQPPNYMGNNPATNSGQGDFDSTIVVDPTNRNIVYVAGDVIDPVTQKQ